MTVKFATLSENTVAGVGFMGEWGLSILVETDELTVLLDTGPGKSAAYNAERLGVDLAKVMEALRLLLLRKSTNYIELSDLDIDEKLPQIALVSNFRKMTG